MDSGNNIDKDIFDYLNFKNPQSFFLFAGAGSGKTRTLVNVLEKISANYKSNLQLENKKVAVITYTNAACDEIKRRLDNNPLFLISTIHSFIWSLIKPYQKDIKSWLYKKTERKIGETEEKLAKARDSTKIKYEEIIIRERERLERIKKVKSFTYSPNGKKSSRDSLNHSDVLQMGADFLSNKPLMQKIMIGKFPILLIDESQDTKKTLIEAFFLLQNKHSDRFSLGLFGDTMQRIYADGKPNLDKILPDDWHKPAKTINYRCPKRVISLLNKIRAAVDNQKQIPGANNKEGIIRLFIIHSGVSNKNNCENIVAKEMSTLTNDQLWERDKGDVKTLVLEHHMAANRMGFIELFAPIYKSSQYSTALLDGSLPELKFFSQLILPLIKAKQKGDDFTVATIMRKNSPLLDRQKLKLKGDKQIEQLKMANKAIKQLLLLWENDNPPLFIEVLESVDKNNLLYVPDTLKLLLDVLKSEKKQNSDIVEEQSTVGGKVEVWREALSTPFSQIEPYYEYVNNKAQFGTHQGVKGLEFPRVMVIIDDKEAKGFMFSYDKLFGIKEQTATDLKNKNEGNETGIDRTTRLFYVTCSRAKESLAVVAYTSNTEKLKEQVLSKEWFKEDEIVELDIK